MSRLQVTARFCCGTRARNCAIKAPCGEHSSSRWPLSVSCGGTQHAKLPASTPPPTTYFTAERTDTTVQHRRPLPGVDRDADLRRAVRAAPRPRPRRLRSLQHDDRPLHRSRHRPRRSVDPLSYSLAVESYEYSKQPMNNTSFESGAGLVAAVRPAAQPAPGHRRRRGGAARRSRPAVRRRRRTPAARRAPTSSSRRRPSDNPLNVYGWPGFWPVFAEFASLRPDASRPSTNGNRLVLQLRRRLRRLGRRRADHRRLRVLLQLAQPARTATHQVEKILAPDALGYATWKQGAVGDQLLGLAARHRRQPDHRRRRRRSAAGRHPTATPSSASIPIPTIRRAGARSTARPASISATSSLEGFQGQTMIDEIDNKAALLLGTLAHRRRRDARAASPRRRRRSTTTTRRRCAGGRRRRLVDRDVAAAAGGQLVALLPAAAALRVARRRQPPARADRARRRLRHLLRAHRLRQRRRRRAAARRAPPSTAIPSPPTTSSPTARRRRTTARSRVIKVALVDIDRLHWDDGAPGARRHRQRQRRRGAARHASSPPFDAAYAIVGMRQALRAISLDADALLQRHARHARAADGARRRQARRRRPRAAARAHARS